MSASKALGWNVKTEVDTGGYVRKDGKSGVSEAMFELPSLWTKNESVTSKRQRGYFYAP